MIAVRNLTVRFGEKTVHENRSFDLPEEGIVLLRGDSGTGKTTLLRVLSGLLKPQSGTVSGLNGRTVSMAFQEPRLLGWKTALENLLLVTEEAKAKELLRALDLEDVAHQRADTLSGGQQQRVSLLRAFAHSTDVVLLDEPFSGLDETNRLRVKKLIETAKLVVLVTHNEDDADLLHVTKTIVL